MFNSIQCKLLCECLKIFCKFEWLKDISIKKKSCNFIRSPESSDSCVMFCCRDLYLVTSLHCALIPDEKHFTGFEKSGKHFAWYSTIPVPCLAQIVPNIRSVWSASDRLWVGIDMGNLRFWIQRRSLCSIKFLLPKKMHKTGQISAGPSNWMVYNMYVFHSLTCDFMQDASCIVKFALTMKVVVKGEISLMWKRILYFIL